MNKLFTISLIGLLLLRVEFMYAQCEKILWQDEFNTTSLDLNNWNYVSGNGCGGSSGCGYGNNELQYYTSGTNNITVSGGNLVITAKNQNNYVNSGSNYTSGKITTEGKKAFRYGRVEARMKIPSAAAIWPAFWMLPENGIWPYTGEIDIMETQNTTTNRVDQTLHFFCTPCGNRQYIGNSYSPGINFADAFHIYAVDWSPGKIEYSIDGVVTRTFTPANSVQAKGGIPNDWSYDRGNWYIILNLAVGGTYTGNTQPIAANYPKELLIDYVRIYATPQTTRTSTLAIIGKEIAFNGTPETYKASTVGVGFAGTGITYNWTVTGGSIVSGQGTGTVVVNWTTNGNRTLSLSADLDAAGTCTATVANLNVLVVAKNCGVILDDYETNRNISKITANGTYTNPVANPGKGGSNSSDFVGQYVRNSGSEYDLIRLDKFITGSPENFRTGKVKFTMDVRSTAPAGTPITIEFNRTSNPGYPQGIHSQYTAVTGPPNVWTKLTFNFASSPNAGLRDADVDRIQILFRPGSFTSDTYFIDNLTAQAAAPVTGAITGNASNVCQASGIPYSVTNTAGSTYAWTVPTGASVTSGNGTNAINVTFGSTAGNVSVVETTSLNCAGAMQSRAVTLTGCATGTKDAQLKTEIAEVFPNPFKGNSNIKINTEDQSSVNVQIFDSKGTLVYTENGITSGFTVEIGKELPVGFYLVRILNKDIFYTTKIIKED